MNEPVFTVRAWRVLWVLMLTTTTSLAWLWDQTTGQAVVSGRLTPLLDGLAALVAAGGVLLLTRMVWRLSGRSAKENRQ